MWSTVLGVDKIDVCIHPNIYREEARRKFTLFHRVCTFKLVRKLFCLSDDHVTPTIGLQYNMTGFKNTLLCICIVQSKRNQ